MILGFVVAILPYLGFPYDINKWIWTVAGLLIMFLLYFSQKGKYNYVSDPLAEEWDRESRDLIVKRHEEEIHPNVIIEEVVVEESPYLSPEEESVIRETKITLRKHKKKLSELLTSDTEVVKDIV